MGTDRIVVGASGDDEAVRRLARQLRDEGHEVVFVGGGQSPAQLVGTAVAEDASRLVVDADDVAWPQIGALVDEAGGGIEVVRTV